MILTNHLFVFPTTLFWPVFKLVIPWKLIQSSSLLVIFPLLKMATLRNKTKLAAINRENHEEHPMNFQERDTNVPRIQENYITQVSEEIEGRVIKKLSQELKKRKVTFWALSPSVTSFFWTHKFGFTPDPFRRHTGTQVEKPGSNWRSFPELSSSWSKGFSEPNLTRLLPNDAYDTNKLLWFATC